jgi:hypothetical protein
MERLLSQLKASYPQLKFTAGKGFVWSPETGEVFYDEKRTGKRARWSLLHETGHALLGHKSYNADYELIRLEVEAWERAKELAAQLGITINEEHIQDCLDTYRDWLYKRSICPQCGTKSIQQNDYAHYRCHNCHTAWRVTPSRFARAYRRSKNVPQSSLVFHLEN